jgi:thiamine biosynthesis lipoprotein
VTESTLGNETVPRVHRQVEHLMGMPISLALRGRHADGPLGRDAWQAVLQELRGVDAMFSTYREDSFISRLRRDEPAAEGWPADVLEVFALGREAERQSGGAFSIVLPASDGSQRIDPSGVVKGWAVERASRFLAALDDTDYCLSAGGDMTCHVADPQRADWRIGIENPRDPGTLIAVVPLRSGAIATSGSAHRGAHIVDPRDGRTPTDVASVTVIAASLTWADIDATTAVVLGRESLRWLQDRPIRGGLVVWADGSTTTVRGSGGSGTEDGR